MTDWIEWVAVFVILSLCVIVVVGAVAGIWYLLQRMGVS